MLTQRSEILKKVCFEGKCYSIIIIFIFSLFYSTDSPKMFIKKKPTQHLFWMLDDAELHFNLITFCS